MAKQSKQNHACPESLISGLVQSSICMCVHTPVRLSVDPSLNSSVCLSFLYPTSVRHPSIQPAVYQFEYTSIRPFDRPYVPLSCASRRHSLLQPFLVADTQLYKKLCPSVGPSVRWSLCPSVCQTQMSRSS